MRRLARGGLVTPAYCLRCELQCALQQTTRRALSQPLAPAGTRHASGFAATSQETERAEEAKAQGVGQDGAVSGTKAVRDRARVRPYEHGYSFGRVLDRLGRRIRVRSETLNIPSMQRPFEVVIMQDMQTPPRDNTAGGNSKDSYSEVNVARVATTPYTLEGQPSMEEVHTSIDQLRPDTHLIDTQRYDALVKALTDGYNSRQLGMYLARCAALYGVRSTNGEPKSGRRSRWEPDTPSLQKTLDDNRSSGKASSESKKAKLAHKILRIGWKLMVESDGQESGELKMSLKPWQIRYLFELQSKDRPNYMHLIGSSLLLQVSRVESDPKDNTLRITATQQNAEAIADILETELLRVDSTEVSVREFASLLGQPGWPSKWDKLFTDVDLEYIGQQTMTVIERRSNGKLQIHGLPESRRERAKRLILSLLHLPSPASVGLLDIDGNLQAEGKLATRQEHIPIYEDFAGRLHFRHRNDRLYRLANPTTKSAAHDRPDSYSTHEARSSLAGRLAHELETDPVMLDVLNQKTTRTDDQASPLKQQSWPQASYWAGIGDFGPLPWEAQICRILLPQSDAQAVRQRRRRQNEQQALQGRDSALRSSPPGLDALLSYFSTRSSGFAFGNEPLFPALTAHFYPSPFTNRGVKILNKLPRVEIYYNLLRESDRESRTDQPILQLSGMRAKLFEQTSNMPLPHEIADLCFARTASMHGKIERVKQDEDIRRFTDTLWRSMSQSSDALDGVPMVKILLPSSVVQDDASNNVVANSINDVEIEYCFERFEQVQILELEPIADPRLSRSTDSAMREMLRRIRDSSLFLEYWEVDGGLIGGRRTELTLKQGERRNVTANSQATTNLVESSMELVRSLTRIHTGAVGALSS